MSQGVESTDSSSLSLVSCRLCIGTCHLALLTLTNLRSYPIVHKLLWRKKGSKWRDSVGFKNKETNNTNGPGRWLHVYLLCKHKDLNFFRTTKKPDLARYTCSPRTVGYRQGGSLCLCLGSLFQMAIMGFNERLSQRKSKEANKIFQH